MWQLRAGREAGRAERVPQYDRHRLKQALLFQGSISAQPVSMLLHCADATGYRLGQRQELAGGRAIERGPFMSVRLNWARFRYDQAGKQWRRLHNGGRFQGK